MSHGDRMKRRRLEKQAQQQPKLTKGKCVLCGKVNPKTLDCPQSANGHITLERE